MFFANEYKNYFIVVILTKLIIRVKIYNSQHSISIYMKKPNLFTFILISFNIFFLSACASITTGNSQSLSVETEPLGAQCKLTNDKGTWYVTNTPGTVNVTRAWGDLSVICKKEEKTGSIIVKSKAKAMNAGNLLFGGVIGLAVDAHTGSGYDYPSLIHVPLK